MRVGWLKNVGSIFLIIIQNMELDEFVVMPNHVHGIIIITETNANVGAKNFRP